MHLSRDKTFEHKASYFTQEFWYLLVRCMTHAWNGTPLTVSGACQQMKSGSNRTREDRVRKAVADGFDRAVGGIVGMVSSSATELQATAQAMTATATETASQSTTVAAAAEELGASVEEIGRAHV